MTSSIDSTVVSRRRVVPTALLALATAFCVLSGPNVEVGPVNLAPAGTVDSADARPYTTQYCRGTTNPGGFVVYTGGTGTNPGTGCALKADFGKNGVQGVWGTGTIGTFTWAAPDNTTITRWDTALAFSVSERASNSTGNWTLTYGPGGAGDQACTANTHCNTVSTPFAGARQVSARLTCVPLADDTRGNCRQGAVMVDTGGVITLDDPNAPTAGGPVRGSATATRPGAPGRGTLSASFSARDQGGGLKAVQLFVDGRQVDTARGNCQGIPSFAKVPCPLALDGTLNLTTSRIADGAHTATVVATDIAGNTTTLDRRTIYVANKPVGPGSPTVLRGAPYSPGAVDAATVSASFPSTARRAPKACRSKSYRRRHKSRCHSHGARSVYSGTWSKHTVVLTGRVANKQNKQGVAGVPVTVTGTTSRVPGQTTYRATTNATGRYTLRIPRRDGSRTLAVSYRARRYDESPAATASARTVIRARATLKAKRTGSRVRFTGHLLDRTRGVPILVQVNQRGRWRTFRTATTRAGGSYRLTYSVKGIDRGTYRFRVQARPTSKTAYPFAHGFSPSVRVRVR